MERRAGTRQGWSPACFNPRSRVGSDDRIFGNEVADHVSIHAPAWGATHNYSNNLSSLSVSIHAPAWGATSKQFSGAPDDKFQSTLPRGERLTESWQEKTRQWTFQSTLPRGERHHQIADRNSQSAFQSTLPRGERLFSFSAAIASLLVSIHAPAWGATISAIILGTFLPCFNPRSRVGSDAYSFAHFIKTLVSIHAPAWGATPDSPFLLCVGSGFNPRSRVGSDDALTA